MELTSIQEAESRLSELVDRAVAGEEIILTRAGAPIARLVPLQENTAPRQGGQWRGRVRIADDFDELPEDISRAFGIDAE